MLRWLKARLCRHSHEDKAAMAQRLDQSRRMKDDLVRKASEHGKFLKP